MLGRQEWPPLAPRATFGGPVTFSYVGYIWAISGCACFTFFLVGIALVLHLIGRRTDRGAPTPSVESVPLRGRAEPPDGRGPDPDGDAS